MKIWCTAYVEGHSFDVELVQMLPQLILGHGRWGGGGPWLGGSGGLSVGGFVVLTLYVAVLRVWGAPPPLVVGAFSLLFSMTWCWPGWPSVSIKILILGPYISESIISVLNIKNSIKTFTRMYQNWTTSQNLVGVSRWESLYTRVIIWVNTILSHINTMPILLRYEGSWMIYRLE